MDKKENAPARVCFEDFLPNNIRNSPIKREISNTSKTMKYKYRSVS